MGTSSSVIQENNSNFISKISKLNELIINAESAYIKSEIRNKSIPSDFKILFLMFRNVTISGKTYSIEKGSIKEKIFYEAVNNFKHSVETFTNKNVNIIPVIKEINENIFSNYTNYLNPADIIKILNDTVQVGIYDSVIAASGPKWDALGITSITIFTNNISNNFSFYGYSSCSIYTEKDADSIGKNYDLNYPYLVTTNIFIHEWMHQLEEYRNIIKPNGQNIIYPYTHAYYEDYIINSKEEWKKKNNYKWNETYFNDTQKYPNVVERRLTSFYRAVLSCEVEYIPNNNHKVGMYPEFWEITPNKIIFGKYIIQNPNSLYLYSRFSSNTTYTSETLSHEIGFYWDIFYDLYNKKLKRKSCIKRYYNPNYNFNDLTCRKIGYFEEGEYYIINKTLNKVLAYSVNNFTISPKLEEYRKTNFQTFKLSHYYNCFYKISPSHTLLRYLDLNNAWDSENNTASFFFWTGYITAQTWQFQYINSNHCFIFPLASITRSLSFHDEKLQITSTPYNIQKWKLEKINNGKFIFDGKYKIKDSLNHKYLCGISNNKLVLDEIGTEWIIKRVDNNNYYTISTNIEGIIKYIDVLNAYEKEGQTIQIQYETGYDSAQNWKFILNHNDTVSLIPKLSFERGLKCKENSSELTKNFGNYILIRTGDL